MSQEAYNQGADQAAQDPTILSRIGSLADTAVNALQETYYNYRNRAVAAIAVGATALGGGVGLALNTETARAQPVQNASKQIRPIAIEVDISDILSREYQDAPLPGVDLTGDNMQPRHIGEVGTCRLTGLEKQAASDHIDYPMAINDRSKVQTDSYCNKVHGHHIVKKIYRRQWPLTTQEVPPNYGPNDIALGKRVAKSYGFSAGNATSISAKDIHYTVGNNGVIPTDTKAVLLYQKNPAIKGKQLKKLILTQVDNHPVKHKALFYGHK